MSITWIPSARVKEAIAQILHKNDNDPLAPEYDGICDEANRLATADLKRILALKGYSGAQIENWSDKGRYALDQAIYWALMRSGGLSGLPDTFARAFDRRKELEESAAILIGGEAVAPGPSDVGGISYGRGAADAVAPCGFFTKKLNY